MDIEISLSCEGVQWQEVAAILKSVGMAYRDPEIHKRAFEASYVTVFLYRQGELLGFGRAISDGEYQAAVYDCAIKTEYQGKGFGRLIMEEMLPKIANCNVILYAAPGREGFYQNHKFRRMKTGMARFIHSEEMAKMGFTE